MGFAHVGKATLKLTGTFDAWAPNVRTALLVRANGGEVPVLVWILEGRPATEASLSEHRDEGRLLARLQHEHALRVEQTSGVGGQLAVVYESFDCVAVHHVLAALAARGQGLPSRVAVEIAAGVAIALEEALKVESGDARLGHRAPTPTTVLLDTGGRVKLAGIEVLRTSAAMQNTPSGYAPPEKVHSWQAATWMAGALLVELLTGQPPPEGSVDPARHEQSVRRAVLRVLSRPGDAPPEVVVAAIKQALAHSPATRGTPGTWGRMLRDVAVQLSTPGLRAWAPGTVPAVQKLALSATKNRIQPPIMRQAPMPSRHDTSVAPAEPLFGADDIELDESMEDDGDATVAGLPISALRSAAAPTRPVAAIPPLSGPPIRPVSAIPTFGTAAPRRPVSALPNPAVPTRPVSALPNPAVPTRPVSALPNPAVPTRPVSALPNPAVPTRPVSALPNPAVASRPVSALPNPAVASRPVSALPNPAVPTRPVSALPISAGPAVVATTRPVGVPLLPPIEPEPEPEPTARMLREPSLAPPTASSVRQFHPLVPDDEPPQLPGPSVGPSRALVPDDEPPPTPGPSVGQSHTLVPDDEPPPTPGPSVGQSHTLVPNEEPPQLPGPSVGPSHPLVPDDHLPPTPGPSVGQSHTLVPNEEPPQLPGPSVGPSHPLVPDDHLPPTPGPSVGPSHPLVPNEEPPQLPGPSVGPSHPLVPDDHLPPTPGPSVGQSHTLVPNEEPPQLPGPSVGPSHPLVPDDHLPPTPGPSVGPSHPLVPDEIGPQVTSSTAEPAGTPAPHTLVPQGEVAKKKQARNKEKRQPESVPFVGRGTSPPGPVVGPNDAGPTLVGTTPTGPSVAGPIIASAAPAGPRVASDVPSEIPSGPTVVSTLSGPNPSNREPVPSSGPAVGPALVPTSISLVAPLPLLDTEVEGEQTVQVSPSKKGPALGPIHDPLGAPVASGALTGPAPRAFVAPVEANEPPRRSPMPMLLVAISAAFVLAAVSVMAMGWWWSAQGRSPAAETAPTITPITQPIPENLPMPTGPSTDAPPAASPPIEIAPAPEKPAPTVTTPSTEPAAVKQISSVTTSVPATPNTITASAPKTPAVAPSPRPVPAATGRTSSTEDAAPARITPTSPSTPTAAASAPGPNPAPTAVPSPSAPAIAPPTNFTVQFIAADPGLTLEVKCMVGAGSGTTVVIADTTRGNCRVVGRTESATVIALVSVTNERTYRCFAGGTRTCQ